MIFDTRFRRAATAVALSGVALAGLVATAPAAGADEPRTKLMRLLDDCDPTDWDPAVSGSVCNAADGSVSFAEFQAELDDGGHGAWWINNRKETIDLGDTIEVENQGGILHSFTEVADFGGGFVPAFNVAVGNAATATPVSPLRFVNPGDSTTVEGLAVGTHKIQCLIHPWMRTVVTVR